MQLFITLAAVVAVAVAGPVQRGLVAPGPAGPTPIVEESPIAVGPAIVEFAPVAVGPAVLDFTPVEQAVVTPEAVATVASESPALIQIIVNINQAELSAPVSVSPVVAPEAIEEIIVPGPVNVVESADADVAPIHVVDEISQPGPVNVVDAVDVAVPVTPVQVVNPVVVDPVAIGTPELPTPVVVDPVIVGTPIIPAPAVVLPETLN